MGVPKFYRWLSERYPLLNQPVKLRGAPQIDNLVGSRVCVARRRRACVLAGRNAAARTPDFRGRSRRVCEPPGTAPRPFAVSAAARLPCVASRRGHSSAVGPPPVTTRAWPRTGLTRARVAFPSVPGHERRDP